MQIKTDAETCPSYREQNRQLAEAQEKLDRLKKKYVEKSEADGLDIETGFIADLAGVSDEYPGLRLALGDKMGYKLSDPWMEALRDETSAEKARMLYFDAIPMILTRTVEKYSNTSLVGIAIGLQNDFEKGSAITISGMMFHKPSR